MDSAADVMTSESVECVAGSWACIGDGLMCNVCIKKSTQHGSASAYKALHDIIEEHIIDGRDDQSLAFFIHSNNGAIRHILQDAINIHK